MADVLMKVSRLLARKTHRQPLRLTAGVSIVSFTFDDAPASACTDGAAVLERHDARGTFYIAGGLTDKTEEGRPCHSVAQLAALHQAGHELACHGWSHQAYDRSPTRTLREELDRNAGFLQQFGSTQPLNFAYPFGAYSLHAKRECGRRFRSCRVTGAGLHQGEVDTAMLGSYRLYGETLAQAHWQIALDRVASGGWLIVNTHEVADDHGPYGCSPTMLEAMVARTRQLGCDILTVDAALDRWQRGAA